jgi:tRNA threonylcarbamoyladenosine biosynthesis protein TsaB
MYSILCIETATEICSVAVVSSSQICSLAENTEGNMHASKLTGLIDEAIKAAGISLQQLDAIAVSMGPGSYTGLRVGVSTAKGLCYTLDKPLIAVPTLQSLAAVGLAGLALDEDSLRQQTAHSSSPILIPMLDARRMEVYCAGFDTGLKEVTLTEAKIIDETSFAASLANGPVYLMGNGANKCKGILTHDHIRFVDGVHCSAVGMQRFAIERFEQKQFEDVAYFEPFYLKDFVATTPKKRV